MDLVDSQVSGSGIAICSMLEANGMEVSLKKNECTASMGLPDNCTRCSYPGSFLLPGHWGGLISVYTGKAC